MSNSRKWNSRLRVLLKVVLGIIIAFGLVYQYKLFYGNSTIGRHIWLTVAAVAVYVVEFGIVYLYSVWSARRTERPQPLETGFLKAIMIGFAVFAGPLHFPNGIYGTPWPISNSLIWLGAGIGMGICEGIWLYRQNRYYTD